MIIAQHENLVVSSFLLWLNNWIANRGQAYNNIGSQFYLTNTRINGYYTYAAPYNQLVADFGVSGANVPTGVYINNSFVQKGTSGFVDINYNRGHVYFTTPVTGTVSGAYGVKDINIAPLTLSEHKLLFETKFSEKPRITQNMTGIANDSISYPVIFIKSVGGSNEPFSFGGVKKTNSQLGLLVFADSQYQLDAVNSLLRDAEDELLPMLNTGDMPYNALGGFKNNVNFNYSTLANGKISSGLYGHIESVDITSFRTKYNANINDMNPDCYFGVIDINIWKPRVS